MAARAMATMMVSDKEGNDDGGKSNGDGNEGSVQVKATRANATATRAMVIMVTGAACDKEARVRVMPKAIRMMRVVGDEEGRGSMGDGNGNEETTTRQQRDDVMTTRRQ